MSNVLLMFFTLKKWFNKYKLEFDGPQSGKDTEALRKTYEKYNFRIPWKSNL